MTCQELLDALGDYVGGDLVIEQTRTVEVHLGGCKRCGVLVETYRHTVKLARALPKCGQLPPEVENRLRKLLEPELKAAE